MPSGSASPGRRRARLAGLILLGLVLAAGAVVLSLTFFSARDKPSVEAVSGPGAEQPDRGNRVIPPGRPGARPPRGPLTSGPHHVAPVTADGARLSDDQVLTALAAGNVILAYGTPQPPAGLRDVAAAVAGAPFDPALGRAGQAVILARRPGTRGVLALAWRHSLAVPPADRGELRAFAEFWLGRGAAG